MPGKQRHSIPLDEVKKVELGFKGGMVSVENATLIPPDASPNCRNVWFDYRYGLSKFPGTELLLDEDKNRFADNPIYQLFDFIQPEGQEQLITQAHNSSGVMKLWSMPVQSSYPASVDVDDITPTNGLSAGVPAWFFAYRGKLYLTNGADPLQSWDGSVTAPLWTEFCAGYTERFRYGTVFDDCIFLAGSMQNPNRVIFSSPNWCYPYHYYIGGYDPNYAARTYYIDIPSEVGDRIIGLKVFENMLLVIKTKTVWAIMGSPVNGAHSLKNLSADKGCVDGRTVQVRGNHVIFANRRHLAGLGNTGVIVSRQDQKLWTTPNLVNLTAAIQDFWDDNISFVEPKDTREIVYSDSQLDTLFATKTWCEYKTTNASDNLPVINFTNDMDTLPTSIAPQVTQNQYVALRSTNDEFFSQSFTSGAGIPCIGKYARIFLKETGTLTSTQKLNVFLCDGQESDTEPNKENAYAEAQITGDVVTGMRYVAFSGGGGGSKTISLEDVVVGAIGGATATVKDILLDSGAWGDGDAAGHLWVKTQSGTFQAENLNIQGGDSDVATIGGDTTPVSTGCWIKAEFTYHNYPQTMRAATNPVCFLMVEPVGDTDSIYFSWGYNDAGGYAGGYMYNSDADNPPSQEDCDYTFNVYANHFRHNAQLISGVISAGSDFVKWGHVFITLDTNTFDDYTRKSVLKKLEFATSADNYATWTEIENGGAFPNITAQNIKIKIFLKRIYINDPLRNDSFSLIRARFSYFTQTDTDTFRSSAIYKDRYFASATIVDPEEPAEPTQIHLDAGLIMIDKNNKIWLRYGGDILPYSAMCVFDNKLVFGVAKDSQLGNDFPNLLFLDETSMYEVGEIITGSAEYNTITSVWTSKQLLAKNDARLEIERFVIAEYGRSGYQAGSNKLTVKYKIDDSAWTQYFQETLHNDGNTHLIYKNKPIKAHKGHLIQFKLEEDQDFEIEWMYCYLNVQPLIPQ